MKKILIVLLFSFCFAGIFQFGDKLGMTKNELSNALIFNQDAIVDITIDLDQANDRIVELEDENVDLTNEIIDLKKIEWYENPFVAGLIGLFIGKVVWR